MEGLERPPQCPACQGGLTQARTQTWNRVVTPQGEARLTLATWTCADGHEWTPPVRAACTRAWPGVPQQACWWHFLKDAGAALLEDAHAQSLREAESLEDSLQADEEVAEWWAVSDANGVQFVVSVRSFSTKRLVIESARAGVVVDVLMLLLLLAIAAVIVGLAIWDRQRRSKR